LRGGRPTSNLADRDSLRRAGTSRQAGPGTGWEPLSLWGQLGSGGERDSGGRRQRGELAGEQKAGADQRSAENLKDVAYRDPVLELLTLEAAPRAQSPVVAKPV
jgi:hypothetical protein